ncbi:hypothetical protein M758_1G312000 [Ceratodon purpureus]|uniref:Uncharacterized protein n=1 Tax=Ceratodon purpureus TaxID=3225 RepID=A0A8T0JF42_CERPU|nr:hypothetical protein KC19_1G318900 [Ceratodon purpureus]KAG0632214.1 hypothetical protein M758_1G312000 [Ceratodon purpureus]
MTVVVESPVVKELWCTEMSWVQARDRKRWASKQALSFFGFWNLIQGGSSVEEQCVSVSANYQLPLTLSFAYHAFGKKAGLSQLIWTGSLLVCYCIQIATALIRLNHHLDILCPEG